MGLFASDHPDVPGMKGLHLFHFMLSNCSQRVRFALEEKGLAWTSHHLNLPANEHLDPDYQRINPNGVVPTLVHDGRVVIESNDILRYLEEHFPETPLAPADDAARARMECCIDEASAIQSAIKVLSHELLFRPFRTFRPEDVARFQSHPDPKLGDFVRDYAENGFAWAERVRGARGEMEAALGRLEAALGEHPWLSGDDFGLADVSWAVNAHRLTQARYPLDCWPRLQTWYEKGLARPAFDRAVLSYTPS